MRNPAIGSMKWAHLTGGSLRRNERLRLTAQAILLRLASMPAHGLHRLGISRAEAAYIDLDRIRIPDTRDARDAFELCAETSPVFLLNHCVRTYLWGALLAAGKQLKYDEELFYVASLLHDLGLTPLRERNGSCSCFAADGATAAQQFAHSRQWPISRQTALSEAICLHLNLQVAPHQGVEAHLLHEGASLDVIGARSREIHGRNKTDVITRYPRSDFKAGMAELMKQEAKIHQASRAGFLVNLGLTRMISSTSFAD